MEEKSLLAEFVLYQKAIKVFAGARIPFGVGFVPRRALSRVASLQLPTVVI